MGYAAVFKWFAMRFPWFFKPRSSLEKTLLDTTGQASAIIKWQQQENKIVFWWAIYDYIIYIYIWWTILYDGLLWIIYGIYRVYKGDKMDHILIPTFEHLILHPLTDLTLHPPHLYPKPRTPKPKCGSARVSFFAMRTGETWQQHPGNASRAAKSSSNNNSNNSNNSSSNNNNSNINICGFYVFFSFVFRWFPWFLWCLTGFHVFFRLSMISMAVCFKLNPFSCSGLTPFSCSKSSPFSCSKLSHFSCSTMCPLPNPNGYRSN